MATRFGRLAEVPDVMDGSVPLVPKLSRAFGELIKDFVPFLLRVQKSGQRNKGVQPWTWADHLGGETSPHSGGRRINDAIHSSTIASKYENLAATKPMAA